jgi:hypothetical protein
MFVLSDSVLVYIYLGSSGVGLTSARRSYIVPAGRVAPYGIVLPLESTLQGVAA